MARNIKRIQATDPPLFPDAQVRVREETIGDLKIRRRITQRRALGGVALLAGFLLTLLVCGAALVLREHRTAAAALLMVLLLAAIIRVLNWKYEREVDARIETMRDQVRPRRPADRHAL